MRIRRFCISRYIQTVFKSARSESATPPGTDTKGSLERQVKAKQFW